MKPITVNQYIPHDELETLLPHKGKMFLLSRVTQHDVFEHTITSEYDITPDCIFYEETLDGVPSWAGFEFMAQGISALTGITNKTLGRKPRPGFLLSVVDFMASVPLLKNGTTIKMNVKEDYRADDVYRYNCALYAHRGDAEPAATAKNTVMETDDVRELFGEKQ